MQLYLEKLRAHRGQFIKDSDQPREIHLNRFSMLEDAFQKIGRGMSVEEALSKFRVCYHQSPYVCACDFLEICCLSSSKCVSSLVGMFFLSVHLYDLCLTQTSCVSSSR